MRFIMSVVFNLFFIATAFPQWNPNTSVNLEVAGLNVSDQQAVSTTDGKTWIAFYTQNSSGNYDMRAQLLDANGFKLLGPDGVLVSNQTSGSATFVFNVTTDIFNNLIIAFQYEVAGTMKSVVTKVNTDGTLPWGNGTILGDGLAPYPAVTKTNEVIVAWNNNSPSTTYIQKLDNSGAILWSSPVAVTVGTSNTTRCQLVSNSNGDFTAVFQKKSFGISTTLYAQRYTTNGAAIWSAPVQLSNQTASAARYYSILAIGNTTYYGYFVSSGFRFSAYVQKINQNGSLPWGINGAPVSSYASGTDPLQQGTQIAHDANSAYVWSVSTYCDVNQTQYGVYVQKFDTTTGTPQLAATGKEVYPISTNFDTHTGNLSLINDGPFFMSYDANYKIYGTRLNSTGDFVWAGNRIELSSTTAGGATAKGRFAFTNAVNGQSVAVWYENRGVEYRSYAQPITASGALPVLIDEFYGTAGETKNILYWSAEQESDVRNYEVEKSFNGIDFQKIGEVAPKGEKNKNNYAFTDWGVVHPNNYYRIKMLSVNGVNNYSKVVVLKNNLSISTAEIQVIYPNPVNSVLTMRVFTPAPSNGVFMISDNSGRLVYSEKTVLKQGINTLNIRVGKWPKGIYRILCLLNNQRLTSVFFKN